MDYGGGDVDVDVDERCCVLKNEVFSGMNLECGTVRPSDKPHDMTQPSMLPHPSPEP